MRFIPKLFSFVCVATLVASPLFAERRPKDQLKEIYDFHCHRSSDINEHLPTLRRLSSECGSIVEIGVRSMVSTWAFLQGLAESPSPHRSYIGIDLALPLFEDLFQAHKLAKTKAIAFDFWLVNDMTINIPAVDFLFIDSLHTYCHLTYELEKFSPQVKKYIAMHDTSDPWGTEDEPFYGSGFIEYDASIDRTKKGLWAAVEDFLARHPEWSLFERYTNSHGLTVLKRVEPLNQF